MKFVHEFLTNLVMGQAQQWGNWTYLLLALFVAVEGPIATLLGATAAAAGLFDPVLVFFFAAIGNLTADMFWYTLGLAGQIGWLQKLAGRFGIREDQWTRMETDMRDHSFRIILLAKLTVSFSIPALIAAGIARVSWYKVMSSLVPGECVWTGGLVITGYYFSQSLKHLERGAQVIALLGGITLLVLFTKYVKTRFGAAGTTATLLDRSLTDSASMTLQGEK